MKPDRHVALLGGAAHHVPVLHRDISEGLHLVEVQISSSLVHDSQCVLVFAGPVQDAVEPALHYLERHREV